MHNGPWCRLRCEQAQCSASAFLKPVAAQAPECNNYANQQCATVNANCQLQNPSALCTCLGLRNQCFNSYNCPMDALVAGAFAGALGFSVTRGQCSVLLRVL